MSQKIPQGTFAPDPSNPVKGCCCPPKMEGLIYNFLTRNSTLFSVDYDLKKMLTRNPDFPQTGWTLVDFGNSVTYVHDGANCFSFTMTDSNLYTRCIPDKAVYVGSGSFGPIGGQPYNSFQFSENGFNETIVVTQAGCIPLLASSETPQERATRLFINLDANVTATDFSMDVSNYPPK